MEPLRDWFLENRRDLPWRDNPTPYRVWVSEVMLQQTQAVTVIPYFYRWMERFPDIATLAAASTDEVIKLWEGLGYYARARHLHAGAQQVMREYGGILPSTAEELSNIKGLGVYTVGAILSFAFREKAAAVDGNVMRVLARYRGIYDDLAKSNTQRQIRLLATHLLPEERPWEVMEGLIELGATVCRRTPDCNRCPLQEDCHAYRDGTTDKLPYKSCKTHYESMHRAVFILLYQGQVLVRRGESGKVMGDLYEFPYVDLTTAPDKDQALDHAALLPPDFGLAMEGEKRELPLVDHSYTRFRVRLYPAVIEIISYEKKPSGYEWISSRELLQLPFSAGHRRILHLLLDLLDN